MADLIPAPGLTWISPQAALNVLRPLYVKDEGAQNVLVTYAGAGLVRTWCRRMAAKRAANYEPVSVEHDNIFIDKHFWEAFSDSGRRLFEDWGTGCFSAQRYQNKEWWVYRAFAVQFCEDDLLTLRSQSNPSGITHAWATELAQAKQTIATLTQGIATLQAQAAVNAGIAPPSGAPEVASLERRVAELDAELASARAASSEVAPTNEAGAPASAATLNAWWGLCKSLRPADAWTMPELQAFFRRCLPDKSVSRDRLRDLRGKQKSGPKERAAE